jgi:hypothetical protein
MRLCNLAMVDVLIASQKLNIIYSVKIELHNREEQKVGESFPLSSRALIAVAGLSSAG